MNLHERELLNHAARRHTRLVAQAEVERALRGTRRDRRYARRFRSWGAARLRGLASRLEPGGRGRLA